MFSDGTEQSLDSEVSDQGVVRSGGGCSREEFSRLYERFAPAVCAFACARLQWRWQEAEDVVAEVWVRSLQKLGTYDSRRPFRPWLFGIASRVVKEAQRRLIRIACLEGYEHRSGSIGKLPDEATRVSQRVAREEDLRRFVKWTRDLTEYEREVLILRGLEGWAHAEVAAALERTPRAVRECWSQLTAKLRDRHLRSDFLAP